MFSQKKNRFLSLAVLVMVLALALAGCSSSGDNNGSATQDGNIPQTGANGNGAEVNVTMPGFSFKLDNNTIPAGPVTFHVSNTDQSTEHEMKVVKTDSQGSQLPTNDQGLVDESQVNVLGEVEVEPGGTKDLNVTLDPGHYVLLCNEPGHYAGGMYLDVTVQ